MTRQSPFNGPLPARHNCAWTEREDYALAQTWGKVPREVIAEKLHRTPYAVEHHAAIVGLHPKRHRDLTADEVAEICGAAAGGGRVADIADRMGVSESAVRSALRRGGARPSSGAHEPAPARPWGADEVERLKGLMRDSVPLPEMARRLGRTRGSVRRKLTWVNENGGCWD